MNLIEELEHLKTERSVLINRLSQLDTRISILAERIQEQRLLNFCSAQNLKFNLGDTIPLTERVREYIMSHFIEAPNPLIFSSGEAKIIGYDAYQNMLTIGSDIVDPTPISIPVDLVLIHQDED